MADEALKGNIYIYIDVARELKRVPAAYFKIKVTEGLVLLDGNIVLALEYGPARTWMQFPPCIFSE